MQSIYYRLWVSYSI